MKAKASRVRRASKRPETFRECFERISPTYLYPSHLAQVIEAVERIEAGESIELVISCPPRHGKTESLMNALAWMLSRNPRRELIFASYSADLAQDKSRIIRGYCERSGVDLARDSNAVGRWRTSAGGGLIASGVGGGQTGFGGDVIIIDDPYKSLADASSSLYRRKVDEWFRSAIYTRRSPGASIVVIQTRWHPDDLAGTLTKAGWQSVNLPALSDMGEPLWPERFSVEELAKIRASVGEFVWSALYQGVPRARGGSVFSDVRLYTELPRGVSYSIGLDMAYSAKTHADYCVAVVLARFGAGPEAQCYVHEVVRAQVGTVAYADRLRDLCDRYPGVTPLWYAYGPETGIADLLRAHGARVNARQGTGDKFVRAQPAAAAWNQGRVLVRSGQPWTDAFVGEVLGFTGVGDDHDDQVDALAAAFDSGASRPAGSLLTGARPMESAALPKASTRTLKW